MARQDARYQQMQRYMGYTLILDLLLFVSFLIASGNGIIWLKIVLFILTILLSLLCLAYLYLTRELLRPRSLWMSAMAAAITVCILFSLILNFPSPNPYRECGDTQTSNTSSEIQN